MFLVYTFVEGRCDYVNDFIVIFIISIVINIIIIVIIVIIVVVIVSIAIIIIFINLVVVISVISDFSSRLISNYLRFPVVGWCAKWARSVIRSCC